MDLSLEVQRAGVRAVVRVVGEVDLNNTAQFRRTMETLIEEPDVEVVVADCSGLEFIDSSGLAALLAVHRTVESRSGRFEVQSAPRMLVKMLRLVGLDDVFHLTSP